MAFIQVIDEKQADGKLKEIYDQIKKSRGKLAEIHKIQSLNPDSIIDHMQLYMTLMFGQSPLKRYQREMIGVVVSATNQCEYCQAHHGQALNYFWKDTNRVEQLKLDFKKLDLNTSDQILCEWAERLSLDPSEKPSEIIKRLKVEGFDDRAILDATLIVAYFNFVNRIVMGLGLDTNPVDAEGYIYD